MVKNRVRAGILILLLLALSAQASSAWDEPLRGTWVADPASLGAIVLTQGDRAVEIVVTNGEHTAVHQAAQFLAKDIAWISGTTPKIVPQPSGDALGYIHLITLGLGPIPASIDQAALDGAWESFHIHAQGQSVYLVGSNFRGTAFAAYTLSERLGIDPLYHWTGYEPERHNPLAMIPQDHLSGPPTFRYRGLFHDDEDILPRPIDPATGYPQIRGVVPTEWYERYFETALRLKLNMVAPFVRVTRPFEVQQMASDWGLYYTSHHYDTLLSNPYGFNHFGLAGQRGVVGGFDWFHNRDGMLTYWRGGVLENRELDAIWPVGMRGTDDVPYTFPPNLTEDEKVELYQEIIDLQVEMTKELLPQEKEPIFHFTLYNEMLDLYRRGRIQLPDEVILVWDDDGDGVMRALPTAQDLQTNKRHGVYYHLTFFGWANKQTVHTVTPLRIAHQFRQIVDSGATEFVLVNVSELREYVMETRMIADIAWDAEGTLGQTNPAYAFVDWWSREYFAGTAEDAARAYHSYYRIMDSYDKVWWGTNHVASLVQSLRQKFRHEPYTLPSSATLNALRDRAKLHADAQALIELTAARMTPQQQQFFFEHVAFGLLIDYRPVQAALLLAEALDTPTLEGAFEMSLQAMQPLRQLEAEILRAERAPFEDWYRATWIRRDDYDYAVSRSNMNPHKSYLIVRDFLEDVGGFVVSRPSDGETVAGRVNVEFATPSPGLSISQVTLLQNGSPVYSGSHLPSTWSIDTTQFSDGPLYIDVVGTAPAIGSDIRRRVLLHVANWWSVMDTLAAPVSTWFGTIHNEKLQSKTDGWQYATDTPNLFYRDESRLVRIGNTTEHVIWEAPRLREVEVVLYVQGTDDALPLALAVSHDDGTWGPLAYDVTRPQNLDGWNQVLVRAEVDGAGESALLRLSLLESDVPADHIQIGEVRLRGSNL